MPTKTCSIDEWRAILQKELTEYEASIGKMTANERKDLHQWVADDNSVKSNPFGICNGNGCLADYISAFRYCVKEHKKTLRKELKEYEAKIGDISDEERKDLREWVAGGNSVYDNPYYLSDEKGNPIDFVGAIRVTAELREEYEKNGPPTVPEFIMPEDGIPF